MQLAARAVWTRRTQADTPRPGIGTTLQVRTPELTGMAFDIFRVVRSWSTTYAASRPATVSSFSSTKNVSFSTMRAPTASRRSCGQVLSSSRSTSSLMRMPVGSARHLMASRMVLKVALALGLISLERRKPIRPEGKRHGPGLGRQLRLFEHGEGFQRRQNERALASQRRGGGFRLALAWSMRSLRPASIRSISRLISHNLARAASAASRWDNE